MYCAYPFCKYLVQDMPKIDKNASCVPKLINGKWPVSLGLLEGQLKKVVGAFPITAANLCPVSCTAPFGHYSNACPRNITGHRPSN